MITKRVFDILDGTPGAQVVYQFGLPASTIDQSTQAQPRPPASATRVLTRLILARLRGQQHDLGYLGLASWPMSGITLGACVFVTKRLCTRTWIHVDSTRLKDMFQQQGWRTRFIKSCLKDTEILAVSGSQADFFARTDLFRSVYLLPHAVSDPNFGPVRQINFSADQPLHIACLSNNEPGDGLTEVLDCIEALNAANLPVRATVLNTHGPPDFAGQISHQVKRRGLDTCVHITNRISEGKKSQLLANADVFIHLSRNGLTPLPVIEALANGCIPIVYDAGDVHEIIGEEFRSNALDVTLAREDVISQIKSLIGLYINYPGQAAYNKQRALYRYLNHFTPALFRQRLMHLLQDAGATKAVYESLDATSGHRPNQNQGPTA